MTQSLSVMHVLRSQMASFQSKGHGCDMVHLIRELMSHVSIVSYPILRYARADLRNNASDR